MDADHLSQEWDNAPMPHTMFFDMHGHAIHGFSDVKHLGMAVSHGCVRLSPDHAATLFNLVSTEGMNETKVVVTGYTPADARRKWSGAPPPPSKPPRRCRSRRTTISRNRRPSTGSNSPRPATASSRRLMASQFRPVTRHRHPRRMTRRPTTGNRRKAITGRRRRPITEATVWAAAILCAAPAAILCGAAHRPVLRHRKLRRFPGINWTRPPLAPTVKLNGRRSGWNVHGVPQKRATRF